MKNIIIGILATLVVVLGGYFIYDKFIAKSQSQSDNNGVNNGNKIKTNIEENSGNGTNNNTSNGNSIQELDLTKCLNSSNSYSNAKELSMDNNYGLSMKMNSDKKSITLSINWSEFNRYADYCGIISGLNDTIEYQITGFNKEIKETYIGTGGQDITGLTLYYLMADGTVEYTKVFTMLNTEAGCRLNLSREDEREFSTSTTFETAGRIDGVENVIKLYSADTSIDHSSYRAIIGATSDGSFYDITK